MKKQKFFISLALLAMAGTALADTPEFSLSYRYKVADTGQIEGGEQLVVLNKAHSETNDARIDKAILVAKLGDLIQETLTGFDSFMSLCEQPMPVYEERAHIIPDRPIPPMPWTECEQAKISMADQLFEKISYFSHQFALTVSASHDEKVAETLDLLRKLAVNMKNFTGYVSPIDFWRGGPAAAIGGGGGGFSVGTGGAQDFGFFKTIVNNGEVPHPDSFSAKGFLSEFDLSMGAGNCNQLLCVSPVYKYESENNRLFVAVALDSNVNESTFVRNALNLALVIDISGSMQATDDTEKSRLEWAKEAAIKTISELNNQDYLSVVVFDTTAEVLVPATKLSSNMEKNHIIDVISKLETKGSTNLYDGLKAAYEIVSDNAQNLNDYNHRVILISDAGLNTGNTDDAVNLSMVSDYAAENIGLTAIGLGLNFNQDFVVGISKSLGGNYVYAHSGQDMLRYFSSFKFLVSPIAHQLKARLSFMNTNASLVKAYGIPGESLNSSDELINIQSLFLTNQGGGAILLEYKLE